MLALAALRTGGVPMCEIAIESKVKYGLGKRGDCNAGKGYICIKGAV